MRILLIVLGIIVLVAGGILVVRYTPSVAKKQKVEDQYAKQGMLMRESEESVSRGLSFLQQGDAGKALFEFNDAIRIDSNNYRAFYNIGLVQRAMGNFDQAEAAYRTAIDLAPAFYATWNNMANLMMMKHAPIDSAIKFIDKAVTACPDCTDYIDTKIDVLITAEKYDDAYALWKKAFTKDSTHYGLKMKQQGFEAMKGKP